MLGNPKPVNLQEPEFAACGAMKSMKKPKGAKIKKVKKMMKTKKVKEPTDKATQVPKSNRAARLGAEIEEFIGTMKDNDSDNDGEASVGCVGGEQGEG